jgi:hypothetical protein
VLPVGIGTRLLDRAQRELVRRLGEPLVVLDLLVIPETACQAVGTRFRGIGHLGAERSPLRLDRPNARRQHSDRGRIVAHVALQDRQVGVRLSQLVAQPGYQGAVRFRRPRRIDQPLAIAERANPGENSLEPVLGLRQLRVCVAERVIARAQ